MSSINKQSGRSDRDEKPTVGRIPATSSHIPPFQYSERALHTGSTLYTGSITSSSGSYYQPSLTTSNIHSDHDNNSRVVEPSTYQGSVSTTSYTPPVQTPYYSTASPNGYTASSNVLSSSQYGYADLASGLTASPYSKVPRSPQYSSLEPYYGVGENYSTPKDLERNELAYTAPRYTQTNPPSAGRKVGEKVWSTNDGSGPYTITSLYRSSQGWICRCRKDDDDPHDPNRPATKDIFAISLRQPRFFVGDRVNVPGRTEVFVVTTVHHSIRHAAFVYALRSQGANSPEMSYVDRGSLRRA